MGYTHYWYTVPELPTDKWQSFKKDCKAILAYCEELGIAIGDFGGNEKSKPVINDNELGFNGRDDQEAGIWTTEQDIIIPWPSPSASIKEMTADPINKTEGNWFAGDLVSQRVAPIRDGKGSGSYETFCIERKQEVKEQWLKSKKDDPKYGKLFAFCKTAYRPYDLAVTACLIAAKQHFGNDIYLSTDGDDKDWMDGRIMCNNLFGYGLSLTLDFELKQV